MTTDTTPIRVLIVDDHELVREGLVGAFARDDGTEVTGAVGTVAEAVAAYADDRPDVIVTDLQLQDGTGLDIIRQVRKSDEKIGLVVVTMHSGDDQIFAAMEAGASAFVGKDAPSTEVLSMPFLTIAFSNGVPARIDWPTSVCAQATGLPSLPSAARSEDSHIGR